MSSPIHSARDMSKGISRAAPGVMATTAVVGEAVVLLNSAAIVLTGAFVFLFFRKMFSSKENYFRGLAILSLPVVLFGIDQSWMISNRMFETRPGVFIFYSDHKASSIVITPAIMFLVVSLIVTSLNARRRAISFACFSHLMIKDELTALHALARHLVLSIPAVILYHYDTQVASFFTHLGLTASVANTVTQVSIFALIYLCVILYTDSMDISGYCSDYKKELATDNEKNSIKSMRREEIGFSVVSILFALMATGLYMLFLKHFTIYYS